MSLAAMTTASEMEVTPARRAAPRWARFKGPALGLLLPVILAVVWEVVVWMSWSSGRVAPPPSGSFAAIAHLRHLRRSRARWRIAAKHARHARKGRRGLCDRCNGRDARRREHRLFRVGTGA